jgi:hypothetical protein
MTTATLSFATPGRVMFRSDEHGIDERRDLDANPPFAQWSQLYETGDWSPEALLGIGLDIGNWLDGAQRWLARLIRGTAPIVLTIETGPHPDPIEKAVLDAPWELVAYLEPTSGAPEPAARTPTPSQPSALAQLFARLGPVDLRRVRHLALDPGRQLTTVRRLGPAAAPPAPSPFRLSVVSSSRGSANATCSRSAATGRCAERRCSPSRARSASVSMRRPTSSRSGSARSRG